jgi:hypothetical protein
MTLRDLLLARFSAARGRLARKGRGGLSKAGVCDFYVARIRAAADCADLQGITLRDVYGATFPAAPPSGRRGSSSFERAANRLKLALYKVNSEVECEEFRLRTNGRLEFRADQPRLDGLLFVAPGEPRREYRASEPVLPTWDAHTGSPRRLRAEIGPDGRSIRMAPDVQLRAGASVVIEAAAEDVLEPRWQPRPLPAEWFRSLIGIVSLGGDALEDEKALWE